MPHPKRLFFLLVLWTFPVLARGVTPAGQAGAFARMGLGARALAMGNAFTGLGRDAFSGYYNPASLPFMPRPELGLSIGVLSLDRSLNYIGFSTYLHPRALPPGAVSRANEKGLRGGFAVGWINAGVQNIDGRDSDGNPAGTFSNAENLFFFSFALQPYRWLAFGLTGKVVNSRFPRLLENNKTLSASGFGYDLGVYAVPFPQLSLGLVLHDISSKYTWNTEKLWERGSTTINRFPPVLRLGAAYRLPAEAIAAFDAEFNREQGWRFYGGLELPYRNLFVSRIGFNADRLTFGFGLKFKVFRYQGELAYAYDSLNITPQPDQYFSWRFFF